MSVRRYLRVALLLSATATAVAPATARAADICVRPATGCAAEHTHDTIQQAFDDAKVAPAEKDTIKLGAATYALPTPTLTVGALVDIVGAGVGTTVLKSTNTAATWDLFLNYVGSSIKDLTLEMGDLSEYGLIINGSTVERVRIQARAGRGLRNDKGLVFNTGSSVVRNTTVDMPYGVADNNDWALWSVAAGGNHVIEDVTLTGDNAIVHHNGGSITVRRARLTGHRVFVINGDGTAVLSDSVVRSTPGSSDTAIGLQNESSGNAVTSMTVKSATVVGPGSHVSLVSSEGVKVGSWDECSGGSATTRLDGVTVTGFSINTLQDGCGATPAYTNTCAEPAPVNSAQLQLTNYHYDGAEFRNPDGGCLGQSNMQTGPANFVSATDLRPMFPSPLIDQGSQDPDDGSKDLAGRTRVVDGDGTVGARRDIGAFEYQRSAPTVSASVDPATGPLSQLFTFTAAGADADGEPLTYSWAFGDGSTPGGSVAQKTFATAGQHSGTVQATDPAGLAAKATAAVTVVGPAPSPTPTPTATPTPVPKDLTPPAVTVKGGALKVSKKRKARVTITCPATETAPCRIKLGASAKGFRSLGKGSGSVPAGRSAKVTLTLTKKAYRHLKRKKRLKAKLAVTATDAAGNAAKQSVRVTLRR